MAEVLKESAVCDGYNVSIRVDGQSHELHFLTQPTTAARDAAIASFEARLQAELVVDEIAENMREVTG
jgi:hypothetical protein